MSWSFWKAALIRAARTFAQAALAFLSTAAASRVEEINWVAVLSSAALAAILSLLTSIATGLPEADKNV